VTFYTPFLYGYVRRLQRLHFGLVRSAPALIRTVLARPQRHIRSVAGAAATLVRTTLNRCDGRYECVRRKGLAANRYTECRQV